MRRIVDEVLGRHDRDGDEIEKSVDIFNSDRRFADRKHTRAAYEQLLGPLAPIPGKRGEIVG
jgi:hypothetical protein